MPQFLIKNPLDFKKIIPYQCIDSSYFLPNEEKVSFGIAKKINHDDIFFDIDIVADTQSPFGHIFPPKEIFLKYCTENSVNYGKNYIFYDHKGIFSAPRVYLTFLAYGFKNIFLLDGGYPAFAKMNHVAVNFNHDDSDTAQINLKDPMNIFVDSDYVTAAMRTASHKIIDARPSGRFMGVISEPRAGLQSGHIPNSINLPFSDLLTADKTFKSVSDMANIFTNLNITKSDNLIFSCGSGVTACVVAFAALVCGFEVKKIKIYDASWCEWGNGNFEIERTA